jgi:hypothetical protein
MVWISLVFDSGLILVLAKRWRASVSAQKFVSSPRIESLAGVNSILTFRLCRLGSLGRCLLILVQLLG